MPLLFFTVLLYHIRFGPTLLAYIWVNPKILGRRWSLTPFGFTSWHPSIHPVTRALLISTHQAKLRERVKDSEERAKTVVHVGDLCWLAEASQPCFVFPPSCASHLAVPLPQSTIDEYFHLVELERDIFWSAAYQLPALEPRQDLGGSAGTERRVLEGAH